MFINAEFQIGQTVYLATDTDQKPNQVTAIKVMPNELLLYQVSRNGGNTLVYGFELTAEKNVVLTTSN